MPEAADMIIIGAGHNGLVTAAYLALAGMRVLVLERWLWGSYWTVRCPAHP